MKAVAMAGTAVYISDGSDFDSTGDEFRSWGYYEGDDEGEKADGGAEVWGFGSKMAAVAAADRIAAGREVVTD